MKNFGKSSRERSKPESRKISGRPYIGGIARGHLCDSTAFFLIVRFGLVSRLIVHVFVTHTRTQSTHSPFSMARSYNAIKCLWVISDLIVAARQLYHSAADVFFLIFSAPNLPNPSVDRHQILTHFDTCSMVTRIYKIGSEIWGSAPKNGGPKRQNLGQISGNLATCSRISLEWNKVLSNGKRRCHLQSVLRMNFGP